MYYTFITTYGTTMSETTRIALAAGLHTLGLRYEAIIAYIERSHFHKFQSLFHCHSHAYQPFVPISIIFQCRNSHSRLGLPFINDYVEQLMDIVTALAYLSCSASQVSTIVLATHRFMTQFFYHIIHHCVTDDINKSRKYKYVRLFNIFADYIQSTNAVTRAVTACCCAETTNSSHHDSVVQTKKIVYCDITNPWEWFWNPTGINCSHH